MRHCPRCKSANVSAHFTPASASTAQEEGFMCGACGLAETRYVNDADYNEWKPRWEDVSSMTYDELAASVSRRAAIADQREREWTWPLEHEPSSWQAVSDRARRAAKLEEHFEETNYTRTTTAGDQLAFSNHKRLPQNPSLFAEVLTHVENDEPRRQYATWLRTTDDPRAPDAADFIDLQLGIAKALRDNPRATTTSQIPDRVFEDPQRVADWWRYPVGGDRGLAGALSDNLAVLVEEGLVADLRWYRGFVEHVTVKGQRFLEIADELFSAAPIRHVTITFAKGLDHQDRGLWQSLLASPHLRRMRSLRFPVHHADHPVAELNRLTDDDLEALAGCAQLAGLRYLDLEDERHLTIRAFRALAASPHLGQLSAIEYKLHRYDQVDFGFAKVGPHTKVFERRPLDAFRQELEAAHGPLPWLHPREHYGSDSPDLEAVVEHPIKRSS